MKTSHLILFGCGIAAYIKRDKLKTIFENGIKEVGNQIADYANSKVSVKLYKFPKFSFSLKHRAIRMTGSVIFENKSGFDIPLSSYQLHVLLQGSESMLLGKTPLSKLDKPLKSNAKTKVDFKFYLPVTVLKPLIQARKYGTYDMYMKVSNLKVSKYQLPDQKIKMTGSWAKVVQILTDPTQAIFDLLNL